MTEHHANDTHHNAHGTESVSVIAAQCLNCGHIEAPVHGDDLYLCAVCKSPALHIGPVDFAVDSEEG